MTQAIKTPTKILRFDDDVVNLFRYSIYSKDGLEMELIDQAAPKTYQKFKKALEALGGRWDKKQKLHLFAVDPRTVIEGLIQSGTLTVEKDGFFPTPPEVTRYIMGRMALGTADYNWLEPEAGDGAMVKVLLEEGYPAERVYAIEKNAERCAALRKLNVRVAHGDFLQYRHRSGVMFHRIIMNPPFEVSQDIHHVRKAYEVLADGGVMGAVMSVGATFRGDRVAGDFRDWLRSVKGYQEQLPEGSFKASGTMTNTCFVVIRK
jgi:predicted RNA methylase